AISNAKNAMQTATDYAALNSHANNPLNQIVAKAYVLYQKELENSQALDFDDLIMKTIELFEKDPETLEYY
ncbi:UvrD-helicase domain-containing protein, partial [Roseburia faecis]|nr:UvrD-helicase domain-containing protein [Roseburia faecis]